MLNPRKSTCIFEAEPGKLDIKRHSPSILRLLVHILQGIFVIYSITFKTETALIKGSNMVYHALTFARSEGRCLKKSRAKLMDLANVTAWLAGFMLGMCKMATRK